MLHDLKQLPPVWSDKTVLVAGGVGFVGRAIVEGLLAVGAREVFVLSRRAVELPKGAKLILLDLFDREATHATLAGRRFDVVINVAGKIDQATNRTIYRDSFDINFFTALNLIQALQDGKVERFLHVGSNAEYGNAWCPQSKETKEIPNTAYGVAKLAATNMVLAKALSESFPACVIRPFLIYGSGQGSFSFLSHAINSARARREFPTTPGEQTRDFVSVEKVVFDLLSIASASEFSPGAIYNSCTGVETRIKDVLIFLKECHPGFKPVFGAMPYRRGELMRSVGVPFAAMSALAAREELFAFLNRETMGRSVAA